MIKLNNKGFAVSTILYGVLSLTILILMLIFGIMKSSKDMNEDLTESLSESMNTCVLLETQLENCYFSEGDNCDELAILYSSCLNNKESVFDLYDVGEIGDYVNYDAGNWTSGVDVPTTDNILMFGGYTNEQSKNISSTCLSEDLYDGWRIFYKSGDKVMLIHAGISECFYLNFSPSYALVYNYQSIMNQTITGVLEQDYNHITKNWNNEYLNDDYALNVHMLSSEDLTIWKTETLGEYTNSELININAGYLLSDTVINNSTAFVKYVSSDGRILETNVGLYGIRPVIELKANIKTSGFNINDYGEKEWILVK